MICPLRNIGLMLAESSDPKIKYKKIFDAQGKLSNQCTKECAWYLDDKCAVTVLASSKK